MQLTFDLDVTRIKKNNLIDWSYSKSQLLGQCNYKFYCSYYGGNGRFKNDDPLKAELRNLKRFSNRYMVIGDAIHVSIEQFFKKRKESKPWTLETAIWFANNILDKSVNYSKNFILGQEEEQFPPSVMKEITQKGVDGEKLLAKAKEQILNCLTTFYKNEGFKKIIDESSRTGHCYIEESFSFRINNEIKVGGKIDFAFTSGDVLKIVDWKTGKEDYEETNLQLLVYALWATKILDFTADKIEIFRGYLLTGKLDRLLITPDQLDRAEATIYQQIEKIKKAEKHALNANHSFFTKRNEELICNLCPFESHCFKEKF
jgi:CRISPR/Cas system-associated exonuclease Cas4 (RecB family)